MKTCTETDYDKNSVHALKERQNRNPLQKHYKRK